MLQQVELYIQAAERELASASKSLVSLQNAPEQQQRQHSSSSALVSSPPQKSVGHRRSTSPAPQDPLDSLSAHERGEAIVSFGTKAVGLLRAAITAFVDDVRNWQQDNATLSLVAAANNNVSTTRSGAGDAGAGGGDDAAVDVSKNSNNVNSSNHTGVSNNMNSSASRMRLLAQPPSLFHPLSAPSPYSDMGTASPERQRQQQQLRQRTAYDDEERGGGSNERDDSPTSQMNLLRVALAAQVVSVNRAAAKVESFNTLQRLFTEWEHFAVERRLLRKLVVASSTSPSSSSAQRHRRQNENATAAAAAAATTERADELAQELDSTERLVDMRDNQHTRLRMLHRWSLSMFRRQYDFASHTLNRRATALDKVVGFNSRLRDQFYLRRQVTHIFFVWCVWASRRRRLRNDSLHLLEAHRAIRSALLDASREQFATLWSVAAHKGGASSAAALFLHHQKRQDASSASSSSFSGSAGALVAVPQQQQQQQQRAPYQEHQEQHGGGLVVGQQQQLQQQSNPAGPHYYYHHHHHHHHQYNYHHSSPPPAANSSGYNSNLVFELPSWEGWEWHRVNAFACELLFEIHESVRNTLLQCSATTTACHFLVFRSALSEMEEGGDSFESYFNLKGSQPRGVITASADGTTPEQTKSDDGQQQQRQQQEDVSKLREAYAALLSHNSHLRRDMRSLESVNSGLQSELQSSVHDRALLRQQQTELEFLLHEAHHTETRLRDHCALSFLLCSSSVAAFLDATEVKMDMWLSCVEQLHLLRLIETEKQIEDVQREMMLNNSSPSNRSKSNSPMRRGVGGGDEDDKNNDYGGDDDSHRHPSQRLVDVTASDPDFDLASPRRVWALLPVVRRAAATTASGPAASGTLSSSSASPAAAAASSSSLLNVEQQPAEEASCSSPVLRVDALSMLLAAHRAFSTWKNAVIDKYRDDAAERTEAADVAWSRLETLTQKHGEAMAQMRQMEKSVAGMKRDVALYRSVDGRLNHSNTADSYIIDSLSPQALMDSAHHQSEIELIIRARCFRRWSTWVAAKLRQRVYEAAEETRAERSADAADSSIMAAWAYEVEASSGVVSSTQVTPERHHAIGAAPAAVGTARSSRKSGGMTPGSAAAAASSYYSPSSPLASPSQYV